jgi:nucleoid-associated protein YgaU
MQGEKAFATVSDHDSTLSGQSSRAALWQNPVSSQKDSSREYKPRDEGKQPMNSKRMQLAKLLLVAPLILGGCAAVVIEDDHTPDAKTHSTEMVETIEAHAAHEYDSSETGNAASHAVVHNVPESDHATETMHGVTNETGSFSHLDSAHHEEENTDTETVLFEDEEMSAEDEIWAEWDEDLYIVERTDQTDGELTYTDSSSYLVVIRPNDYLGKIAQREYNNPGKWRNIYNWNRELIGDDPNALHPYRELELFKPEEEINDWTYEYIIHLVDQGETLWSIARDWYGDNLAWIILYSDNEELFNSNGGRLTQGMELRIRTGLFEPDTDEYDMYSAASHAE